jgi:hypothetical protein
MLQEWSQKNFEGTQQKNKILQQLVQNNVVYFFNCKDLV